MPLTPTVRLKFLSIYMRDARLKAGVEPKEVAKLLGRDTTRVTKMEKGREGLTPGDAKMLLDHYDVHTEEEKAEIVELARTRSQRGRWSGHQRCRWSSARTTTSSGTPASCACTAPSWCRVCCRRCPTCGRCWSPGKTGSIPRRSTAWSPCGWSASRVVPRGADRRRVRAERELPAARVRRQRRDARADDAPGEPRAAAQHPAPGAAVRRAGRCEHVRLHHVARARAHVRATVGHDLRREPAPRRLPRRRWRSQRLLQAVGRPHRERPGSGRIRGGSSWVSPRASPDRAEVVPRHDAGLLGCPVQDFELHRERRHLRGSGGGPGVRGRPRHRRTARVGTWPSPRGPSRRSCVRWWTSAPGRPRRTPRRLRSRRRNR